MPPRDRGEYYAQGAVEALGERLGVVDVPAPAQEAIAATLRDAFLAGWSGSQLEPRPVIRRGALRVVLIERAGLRLTGAQVDTLAEAVAVAFKAGQLAAAEGKRGGVAQPHRRGRR